MGNRRALLLVLMGLGGCGGSPEQRACTRSSDCRVGEVCLDEVCRPDTSPADASVPADRPPSLEDACTGGGCADAPPAPHAASCSALPAGSASGPYTLRSAAGADWRTYCEMDANGGGWTLVLKVDGNAPTFAYDSALWTSREPLNADSADLSPTEAKLEGFASIPFSEVRIAMTDPTDGATRSAILRTPLSATSLRDVFEGPPIATSLGAVGWRSLVASPSVQANLACEGFNQIGTVVELSYAVRLGALFNNETDCGTPDSRIGIGGRQDTTIARWGIAPCPAQVANTAGNAAMCSDVIPPCADLRVFAYVFVR